MIVASNYPTVFAKRLARQVGLYTKVTNLEHRITISDYAEDELDAHVTLGEFQQMAIAAGFKSCLVAYHGIDLTDDQLLALEVIHKSTTPWLLGHVVGQLTEKMNNSNDKDFVDAAETILDNLISENKGGKGVGSKTARNLIVKLKK